MRLHAYSTRQRFLVHGNPGAIINIDLSLNRHQFTVRWKRFDALQKTYLAIILAFIIQVCSHSKLMHCRKLLDHQRILTKQGP